MIGDFDSESPWSSNFVSVANERSRLMIRVWYPPH